MEQATFGGGCFWCTEAVFQRLRGVRRVESGYAGGKVENPTYEQVCTGKTGHAEVIQVTFDPGEIAYADLLNVFFHVHDPTTLDRQGNDIGSQYRSIIFVHSEEQERTAGQVLQEIDESGLWPNPIVTRVERLGRYYSAEEYHQNFFERNPEQSYCRVVIPPKLQKLEKHFAHLLA